MNKQERKSKNIHPRKLQGRPMRQSFLIYCEGETEVGYFNAFKKRAKSLKGGDALAVVNEAIKQKNAAIKQVDNYWVVFDKDNITDVNFNAAITLAIQNQMLPAWSNQAFELWFILHYRHYTQPCNRNQYQAILRQYIPWYNAADKSEEQGEKLYLATKKLIETGIANARAGYESFDEALTPAQKESTTKLYELVSKILANS